MKLLLTLLAIQLASAGDSLFSELDGKGYVKRLIEFEDDGHVVTLTSYLEPGVRRVSEWKDGRPLRLTVSKDLPEKSEARVFEKPAASSTPPLAKPERATAERIYGKPLDEKLFGAVAVFEQKTGGLLKHKFEKDRAGNLKKVGDEWLPAPKVGY